MQHNHSATTTTAPQKAVHGTHWHYNGSVKLSMHLAIKVVAFAEVALCACVCVYAWKCLHVNMCIDVYLPTLHQEQVFKKTNFNNH